jgi:hypothetical protein
MAQRDKGKERDAFFLCRSKARAFLDQLVPPPPTEERTLSYNNNPKQQHHFYISIIIHVSTFTFRSHLSIIIIFINWYTTAKIKLTKELKISDDLTQK